MIRLLGISLVICARGIAASAGEFTSPSATTTTTTTTTTSLPEEQRESQDKRLFHLESENSFVPEEADMEKTSIMETEQATPSRSHGGRFHAHPAVPALDDQPMKDWGNHEADTTRLRGSGVGSASGINDDA